MNNSYFRNRPVEISLKPGDVKAFSSLHSGNFTCPELCHPYDKLVLVRHGEGTFLLGEEGDKRKHFDIQAGMLLHIPKNVCHSYCDRSPLSLGGICFESLGDAAFLMENLESLAGDKERIYHLHSPVLIERFARLVQLLIRDEGMSYSSLRSRALFTDFLVELVRYKESEKERNNMTRVLSYLQDNFTRNISLDDLSELTGLSRRRVSGLFRERTSLSVVDYLHKLRIDYACQQLRNHGVIAMAAHDSGFNDLSHFFRIFKKIKSMTPGEFLCR